VTSSWSFILQQHINLKYSYMSEMSQSRPMCNAYLFPWLPMNAKEPLLMIKHGLWLTLQTRCLASTVTVEQRVDIKETNHITRTLIDSVYYKPIKLRLIKKKSGNVASVAKSLLW